MFENIIGQAEAIRRLSQDIKDGQLPGSLLFDGPPLSAKLSGALELARVSSCDDGAAWNCDCPQCAKHRALTHSDLLLLGPKTSRAELAIAVDMLDQAPTPASRYFFIRAVRKVCKRFDPELYGNEEARLAKIQPLLRIVMEGLEYCLPGNGDGRLAATEARKLLTTCEKLHDQIPASTPVFQVRSIEHQARQGAWHRRRLIVIEHADSMMDAARNALLKILEEPPEQTTFVLTTSRRQAIIPTILSRLRPYRFVQRDAAAARQVLVRVFRIDQREPDLALDTSIGDYFAQHRGGAMETVTLQARRFLLAVLAERHDDGLVLDGQPLAAMRDSHQPAAAVMAGILKETANFGGSVDAMSWLFPAFLEEGGRLLADWLRDSRSPGLLRFAERFAACSRDSLMRYTAYNLNPAALGEWLLASLSDTNPAS